MPVEAVVAIDLEKERAEILKRYRKLLRSAKPFLQNDDAKNIKRAFMMSAEAHKEMRRKSGEPYIYHPIAVAQICVDEIGLGPTAIVAALLHDVVEDTEIELSDIEKVFGKKVAQIIDGLTKISGTFEYGTSQQAENFRKMLLTLSEDIRVILIKLADRLHNMRTLSSMAKDKQLKIASETLYLYAPLAHRLGLHAIKTELEDLGLKYTEPEVYKEIARKLSDNKRSRESFVEHFIKPIKKDLDEKKYKYSIKGRPKSIYSIYNKIKSSNTSFENIFDLFAVRIVLNAPREREKAECWEVYSIVTDHYKPNPDRLKDWVSTPKSNGYESLHTTVMSKPYASEKTGRWVEVQIRSHRMDEIAEKGVAAHWKYKGNDTRTNDTFESWLSQVREALENTDKGKSAVELVDEIKNSLYNEEVFVFTPKGKLIVLQAGATALDFAFDIHSEVGARCIGAKVGGKLVPLSHKLQNGDQIEILTSAKQKPSEDWLRLVVTTKAKTRIKDFIKEENKSHVVHGRDLIEHRLKIMGIPHLTLEITNQLRAYYNAKDANDLFYRFGKGYIQVDQLKHWKADREMHERKQAEKVIQLPITDGKTFTKEIKKLHGERKDADALLIGEDMDKVDYTLAKCCNPISGDDVFGFVTINEGIKIHRTKCPNATELMSRHGDRVIKAQWASQIQMSFTVNLLISGIDRAGLVHDVTRVISSELKVNIMGLNIGVNDGLFEGKITLMVHDTDHLDLLVQQLEQVSGVVEVSRGE
ncbi:GTP pyrophosphokinase [Pseudarcicella hirudinis]|uniref:GTP pyrophosphokinase n=1 Tax=Pseudarcicella hirudinis TaxID=1079859 RepID=A0A1I5UBQ6_9BACT|nr:RelA/SpoT family protein [Pseudarcicella hirudinis]SFP92719.1 GTP pyrophosphokinase [Pseudarcicella hirudinis]